MLLGVMLQLQVKYENQCSVSFVNIRLDFESANVTFKNSAHGSSIARLNLDMALLLV